MRRLEEEREEDQWARGRDAEALQMMCWSILVRTLRDLCTYHGRRRPKERELYETAFGWIFEYDPEDEEQPLSFTWVCGMLGIDHHQASHCIWRMRGEGFQALKRALDSIREQSS